MKVSDKVFTTKQYAIKYLHINTKSVITQEELNKIIDDLKIDKWDYPLEEEDYCNENNIKFVVVVDSKNEKRLREV